MLRVGIIGGGLGGLTAAYKLSRSGCKVTLFERDSVLGGLAGSFNLAGSQIERYYHFICGNDDDILALCNEIGLSSEINWRVAKTSFFYEGKMYAFGTPFDLMRFSPVDILGRLRFGLNVIHSRYRTDWDELDKQPAKDWLIKQIGQRAYEVIWHPLLKVKFGDYYNRISAAWMWHRIHRVATSRKKLLERERFAYLRSGTKSLVEALASEIKSQGGRILLNRGADGLKVDDGTVKGIWSAGELFDFDAVISAVPLPSLATILPPETENFKKKVERVDYIGIVCALFKLKQPITDSFWLNINDRRVTINGIIEYSNLNPCPQYGGSAIVYVPHYMSHKEDRFSYSDERLVAEYMEMFRLLNPSFKPDWVEECHVFRDRYAQAICTTHFKELVLPHKAPLGNLYLVDSTQMYPSDRTLSETIRLALKVSAMISEGSVNQEPAIARR